MDGVMRQGQIVRVIARVSFKLSFWVLSDVPVESVRIGRDEAKWMATYRCVSPFMVDMDKSSFYIGKNLYLVLQLLADVVCLPEWGIAVHHDINFHKVILQSRVRLASIISRRLIYTQVHSAAKWNFSLRSIEIKEINKHDMHERYQFSRFRR